MRHIPSTTRIRVRGYPAGGYLITGTMTRDLRCQLNDAQSYGLRPLAIEAELEILTTWIQADYEETLSI